ncbi:MAG TPA: RNA polymerase sigma-70 factor [Pseudonocardiaceae bacterium]|jgi:RNA polymerase sigma-70 factor (ECF subfamily)|nr:RNA polymerase sigma-70 factor [Pseudonocardiaceae bacterium]
MAAAPEALQTFEEQRPRLFAIAYRLLGSASEAEDAVQDTFLRWHCADVQTLQSPAAWLTKVLTNLCLSRLTSARARRESYPGPWLPEPVLTGQSALGPLDRAEQRESVSLAFLLLLERLTPPQRAVFVLREAFDYTHREIAEILDLTEANCQQLYRRARLRVAEDRPRFPQRSRASREHGHRIAEEFLAAARSGDLAALESLLAADVVAWADGGGKVAAARRPVHGVPRVARYLAGWMSRDVPGVQIMVTEVNGQPGILGVLDGQVLVAVLLDVVGDEVATVHAVANPDKLTFLAGQLL